MNKTFNLQDQIENMYSGLRSSVLFTLCGSINATLVSEAERIINELELDGADFNEIEPMSIVLLMQGNETGVQTPNERISDMQHLVALGEVWGNILRSLTNKPADGTLTNTLNFMTGQQNSKPLRGAAVLKALGIERTPEQNAAMIEERRTQDQFYADKRALKRGHIEWIIEKVFTTCDIGNTDDYWEGLSYARKEALANKALTAVNNAYNTAIKNVMFGNTGDNMLGASDILLIKDIIPRLTKLFADDEDEVNIPTGKGQFKRVPKAEAARAR